MGKKTDVASVRPSSERLEGLTKGSRSKCQLFYSLRWLSYVFNLVVNTKLPVFPMALRSVVLESR